MRVVLTHTDLRLYWEARILRLNARLREREDELHVLELGDRGSPYDAIGDCRPVGGSLAWNRLLRGDLRLLSPAVMSKALQKALDRLDPDVVISGPIAFPSGAAAVRWCRDHRRPVIVMDDARLADVRRSSITNYVKRRIYRNVDAVLIAAPSHASSYRSWGMPADRICFGVDVIDNDWFFKRAEAERACAAGKSRLGLPGRFFLGVGRQIAQKNWATLLLAYQRYKALVSGEPWSLVLVGEGPERPAMERLVREQRIAGVRFLPFLNHEELCVCYAHAGAFVLPSHGETWGLVVNEAMACGLPVLVRAYPKMMFVERRL
jgi:glycosyltransferase involved in cell wall biosynthesis